jgi:hypothetical protein
MTVKAKSKQAWHGSCTNSTGFEAVHHKTVGFPGCATKPKPKDWSAEIGFVCTGKLRGG